MGVKGKEGDRVGMANCKREPSGDTRKESTNCH